MEDEIDRLRAEHNDRIVEFSEWSEWWEEVGRYFDPDTSDVPWFDKREELAQKAFEAGKESK